MSVRDWDIHFMAKAHLNATMSTCRRRSVGAVAVIGNRQIADGFNGNVPGALHCNEGGCARCADETLGSGIDLHLCVCVHAEQNLVAFCARRGLATAGARCYLTTRPCVDCTKLLVSAGFTEIVFDDDYAQVNPNLELIGMTLRKWDSGKSA